MNGSSDTTTNTTTPSSSNNSSKKKTPSENPFEGFPDHTTMPAKQYLETLCRIMTCYLNEHHISDYKPVMEKYLSPKFKYSAEGPNAFLNSSTREEYYGKLVALAQNAPDIVVEPTDMLSDVDEVRGKATLRGSSRIKALFETSSLIVRECIEVTQWSRQADGSWQCQRMDLMTGPGMGTFDV